MREQNSTINKLLSITMTNMLILAVAVGSITLLQSGVQDAFAHKDPGTCNTTSGNISLTVLLSGTPLGVGAPLIPGILVDYLATLLEPTDVAGLIHCAFEDGGNAAIPVGGITITPPNSIPNVVNPNPPIPCIGGTTNADDQIGAVDCGTMLTFFQSDLAPYTVNCTQVGGSGELEATADYAGLAHNTAGDLNPAGATAGTQINNPCLTPSTNLTKSASPPSGSAPLAVTYTFRETNDGDANLKNVNITDSNLSCIPARVLPDDPGDEDNILEPGETWRFTCGPINFNNPGNFTNTAFAEGIACMDDPSTGPVDCDISGALLTGDPSCQPNNVTICQSAERDSVTVRADKRTPQITTQSTPSAGNQVPGVAVTDKATVSGTGPTPTGTVTFFLCGPGLANPTTPAGCPVGGTQIGAAVPLNGGGMATSAAASGPTTTPNGKYCWRAEYSGNGNYTSGSHTNNLINNNGGECFSVGPPPPQTGTIIIKKDTVPNGPQDFKFTHNISSNPAISSPFMLDDDSNPTLPNMRTFLDVPAGDYIVTETTVPAIPLLSIICADPTGDSVRSGNSADIELSAGETVTCTFINGVEEAPCENGQLPSQPEDTISMTTIRSNNIVKTIHAEKQIFNCELPQGDIPVIADVTIIAEIFEDINTKTVIGKHVEVVTCIKMNATAAVLECSLSIPSQDRTPVANCSESPIEHPQEMNTIRKGATVKTIETQKEVFICTFADGTDPPESENPNDKKVDLVLFTEIYQNLNTLTSEDPQVLSMKCVIKIDNVKVESCRFTNHPV